MQQEANWWEWMTEPEARPVAATEEGSDSNSPAPPLPALSSSTTSSSLELLFQHGLDFLLPLSYLEIQANLGHVQ